MTTCIRSGPGKRSASVGSKSFDAETRTLTLVMATNTPCVTLRMVQEDNGEWNYVEVDEVLDPAGCVNLGDIAGIPLVDSHVYDSINRLLGVVVAGRQIGNGIEVDVKLSGRPEVRKFDQDILDGIVGEVSIGFSRIKSSDPVKGADGRLSVTVEQYRADEVSLVILPADPNCGIRSQSVSKEKTTETVAALEDEKISVRALRFIFEGFGLRGKREDAESSSEDAGEDESAEDRAKREKCEKDAAAAADKEKADAETKSKRAAETATAVEALRGLAKRHKIEAEFEVLVSTGAEVSELRQVISARMSTVTPEGRSVSFGNDGKPVETDTDTAPLTFENSVVGKRAAARRAK